MKTLKKISRFIGEHIDPKAIKLLLCAGLGVGVYSLLALFLPMEYPMFILNTVFIVTQLNLALTKTASLERIIGTVASILLGLGFYFLSGGAYWIAPIGLAVAAFLSFMFFRHIVNVLLICTCMLMFNTSGGHPFEYATARIINTVLGLAIALLVALLYTHPYRRQPVYQEYRALLAEIQEMIRAFEQQDKNTPADALLAKISAVAALEVKMTTDTGVLSAPFRQRIIQVSGDLNQILCQFGALQALPGDDAEGIRIQRQRVDELVAETGKLLDTLETM